MSVDSSELIGRHYKLNSLNDWRQSSSVGRSVLWILKHNQELDLKRRHIQSLAIFVKQNPTASRDISIYTLNVNATDCQLHKLNINYDYRLVRWQQIIGKCVLVEIQVHQRRRISYQMLHVRRQLLFAIIL